MHHSEPKSVSDLIDLWRTTPVGRKRGPVIAFAEDIGTCENSARSMKIRGSIAKRHWHRVLAAAQRHALDPTTDPQFSAVTAQLLLMLSIPGGLKPELETIQTNRVAA